MRAALTFALGTLLLGGCTPGAAMPTSGGGSAGGNVVKIDVNLTLHAPSTVPAGQAGGFSPAQTIVAVGDTVQFTNSDGTGINHTATMIGGGVTTFPAGSPFTTTAQTQSGSSVSGGFSSGILTPGSTSQTIHIDAPGTYLYGCFYHYGSPMRGEIDAH